MYNNRVSSIQRSFTPVWPVPDSSHLLIGQPQSPLPSNLYVKKSLLPYCFLFCTKFSTVCTSCVFFFCISIYVSFLQFINEINYENSILFSELVCIMQPSVYLRSFISFAWILLQILSAPNQYSLLNKNISTVCAFFKYQFCCIFCFDLQDPILNLANIIEFLYKVSKQDCRF